MGNKCSVHCIDGLPMRHGRVLQLLNGMAHQHKVGIVLVVIVESYQVGMVLLKILQGDIHGCHPGNIFLEEVS